jgi:hypothetical protein
MLVAHHPWAVRRAPVNIAKLLLDQWTNTILVAVMAMVTRQILSPHDLRLVSTALVALVSDPIVRRKYSQHRRCSEPRRRHGTAGTRHHCFPFAHAAPLAERAATCASIVIKRHGSPASLPILGRSMRLDRPAGHGAGEKQVARNPAGVDALECAQTTGKSCQFFSSGRKQQVKKKPEDTPREP